jgi:twinkle protein
MAFVKFHVACTACGSSDAVSINDNGSAKCFSCGTFFPNYEEPDNVVQKPVHLNEVYSRENITMSSPVISQDSYTGVFGDLRDRCISEDTARHYNVRVTYNSEGEIDKHYYPYYANNELVAHKIRKVKTKGFTSQGKIQEAELFGQTLCNPGAKYITITEGECDAMAAYELTGSRWPVVSIKNGAQSAAADVKKNLEFLSSFENVIICFDSDKAGRDAAKTVAGLFPPNKAKIMTLPAEYKDANDMLRKAQHKKFVDCFWQAKTITPAGIIRVSEKFSAWKDRTEKESIPYPWGVLNEKLHGIRKGELVTVCGGTGLGKTSVTRELEHWILNNSEDNIGIIALEEDWRRTVDGILAIDCNEKIHLEEVRAKYTEEELDNLYQRVLSNDKLFIHSHFGINTVEEIFAKIRYLIVGCECKWIVLDHLHMLVSALEGGDERRLIDNIMTQLRSLVEETGAGLILVSHLRKIEGNAGHENGAEVNISHLRGSGAIAQLSDCVIALERNQQAEDKTEANTTRIRILKSRHTGEVGLAGNLLYDSISGRLVETEFTNTLIDDIPF